MPKINDGPVDESVDNAELDKLVYKIGQCTDFQCLYALEEGFNRCGLTVQTTSGNRMILCKLRDGKPLTEQVIDDYIFVGSLNERTKELSERITEKICDFVRTNAGKAGVLANNARVWRNGLRLYETTIRIMNEDVNTVAGDMLLG